MGRILETLAQDLRYAIALMAGLIALLASIGPAWRAIRVDPHTALRAE